MVNKKVKRLALKSVLSAKAADNKIIVAGSLLTPGLLAATGYLGAGQGALGALTAVGQVVFDYFMHNVPTARMLSVYDLVNAKYLVVDKNALATIEEVYA